MNPNLGPEYSLIEHAIPNDYVGPSSAEDMLREAFPSANGEGVVVLDFGCGAGHGRDVIQGLLPGARYHGVDIESSPEVDGRVRNDTDFETYDGFSLPYEDGTFDLVYTRQVFEHVRHPDIAVREIRRVLAPHGIFLGSLSNLEPYHSYSIFNYTPYGVFRLVEDNGFSLQRLRPGPEGISLIVRQLTLRRIGRFQFAYPIISAAARHSRWDGRLSNYLRLRFSGHICFIAKRCE